MSDSADLTGQWTGLYNYPNGGRPVPFEAVLRDNGGAVTGTTTEVSDLPGRRGDTLRAVIDGHREGNAIRFLKMYEADENYDAVHYQGTVHDDGNEIDGRWEIPGVWSGTFLMIRAAGAEESIVVETEAPVEMPR